MSWKTSDFLAGIGALLDASGAGTWDPAALIPSGGSVSDVIVEGALPPEATNGIGMTPYSLTNRRTSASGEVTQPVQLYLIGPDAWVNDTADTIFDALNGLRDVEIGGVHCVLIQLHSDVQLGVDDHGRRERAVNFDFWVTRRTAQTLT